MNQLLAPFPVTPSITEKKKKTSALQASGSSILNSSIILNPISGIIGGHQNAQQNSTQQSNTNNLLGYIVGNNIAGNNSGGSNGLNSGGLIGSGLGLGGALGAPTRGSSSSSNEGKEVFQDSDGNVMQMGTIQIQRPDHGSCSSTSGGASGSSTTGTGSAPGSGSGSARNSNVRSSILHIDSQIAHIIQDISNIRNSINGSGTQTTPSTSANGNGLNTEFRDGLHSTSSVAANSTSIANGNGTNAQAQNGNVVVGNFVGNAHGNGRTVTSNLKPEEHPKDRTGINSRQSSASEVSTTSRGESSHSMSSHISRQDHSSSNASSSNFSQKQDKDSVQGNASCNGTGSNNGISGNNSGHRDSVSSSGAGSSAAASENVRQYANHLHSNKGQKTLKRRLTVFRDDRSSQDARQVVNKLLLAALEEAQPLPSPKRKCGWTPPPTSQLFPKPGSIANNTLTDEAGNFLGTGDPSNGNRGLYGGPFLEFSAGFESGNLFLVNFVENIYPENQAEDPLALLDAALVDQTNSSSAGLNGNSGDLDGGNGGNAGGSSSIPNSVSNSSSANPSPGGKLEYECWMRGDSQVGSGAICQWFFFAAKKKENHKNVTFRIMNFKKPKSCYQVGMQPYVYRMKQGKDTLNNVWHGNCCKHVEYYPSNGMSTGLVGGTTNSNNAAGHNPVTGSYLGDTFSALPKAENYILSFDFEFEKDDDVVFFAAYPPYTYTMLLRFLREVDQLNSPNIAKKEIGRTLANIPVPLLIISNPREAPQNGQQNQIAGQPNLNGHHYNAAPVTHKKDVVIIARQHPGEAVGSWACQGFIKFLIGNSSLANALRSTHTFHIVPMVNVDGVVFGNTRCTLLGVDPNRCWVDPNSVLHPIEAKVKGYVNSLNFINTDTAGSGTGPTVYNGNGAAYNGTNPAGVSSSGVEDDMHPSDLSDREHHYRASANTTAGKTQSTSQNAYEKFSLGSGTAATSSSAPNNARKKNVALFLDIHGHSARTHAFLYGCLPTTIRGMGSNVSPYMVQQGFLEEESNMELQRMILGPKIVPPENPGGSPTIASNHCSPRKQNSGFANGSWANFFNTQLHSGANGSAGTSVQTETDLLLATAAGLDKPKKSKLLNFLAQHALFPKVCSLASTDFSMQHCNWHVSRAHKKAARWVMYKQVEILNSFTVEISLFGIQSVGVGSERTVQLFTPRRAEWIGVALGRALVPYLHQSGDSNGGRRDCSASPVTLPFLTFDRLQNDKLVEKCIRSLELSLSHSITNTSTFELLAQANGGHSESDNSQAEETKNKRRPKKVEKKEPKATKTTGKRKKKATGNK